MAARGIGQSSTNEEVHVLSTQSLKKEGKGGKKEYFERNRDKGSDDAPAFKKKWDLSRVQCFRCDKFGHYAKDCPTRPNQHASFADVDKISPQNDSREFLLQVMGMCSSHEGCEPI